MSFVNSPAVEKFKGLKVGALFMDMGTGKTKTILDIYKNKSTDMPIVYICPASLIKQTKEEVIKWMEPKEIHFFSSESIGSSDGAIVKLDGLLRSRDCFLIVDESIKFKNITSKRTDRLKKIAQMAKYRFILNGTPMTRSILDLLAQMDILSPKILNMSEAEFAKKFLEYKIDGGYCAWRSWSRPHNEEALMAMIEPYVYEESFCFDHEVKEEEIIVRHNSQELVDYQEFKREVLQKPSLGFLETAQAFQQFYTINCKEKMEMIKEFLKGEDTLFFVKYVKWIEILLGLDCNLGVYSGDRKDDLDNFRNAVLTYGCGSFGLNLQRFNRIVFVDLTFDYGQQIQAMSRIKRRGQERDIEIITLACTNGLEQIIRTSLEKKSGSSKNIKKILEEMSKEDMEKKL